MAPLPPPPADVNMDMDTTPTPSEQKRKRRASQVEGSGSKKTPSKVPKTDKAKDVSVVVEKMKALKVVSELTHAT